MNGTRKVNKWNARQIPSLFECQEIDHYFLGNRRNIPHHEMSGHAITHINADWQWNAVVSHHSFSPIKVASVVAMSIRWRAVIVVKLKKEIRILRELSKTSSKCDAIFDMRTEGITRPVIANQLLSKKSKQEEFATIGFQTSSILSLRNCQEED